MAQRLGKYKISDTAVINAIVIKVKSFLTSHENSHYPGSYKDFRQEIVNIVRDEAGIGSANAGYAARVIQNELRRLNVIAVDKQNNVYVSDWGNERVQILSEHGSHIQTLRGEATLSKWAKEWYGKLPDQLENRENANLMPDLPSQFSTPYQKSAQTEPYFWGPVSVKIDANKRLYVVESLRHRIQVFSI